jgi:predicted DNA-binding protein
MPAKHPRIMTVVNEELAQWLRRRSEAEGRSVSLVVREILAKQYAEDEERFWAKEGEKRLKTFDRKTAVSHEDAWT